MRPDRTHSKRMAWARVAVLVVISACLVGCGFKLRGQMVLPDQLQTLSIETSDRTTPFVQALVGQLRANGVSLVDANRGDASVLRIDNQRLRRQALTISQDARVREYVLHLDVSYRLEGPDGERLIADQRVRLSREYQFDEQAILGGSREEEFLGEDLSRAMAVQVMRQLAAATESSP